MNSCELKSFNENLFSITPCLSAPEEYSQSFNSFIDSIEQLLEKILPKDLFSKALEDPSQEQINKCFELLLQSLPLIHYSDLDQSDHFSLGKSKFFISFTVLCDGEYTHGIGRFLTDMLCKWLIPGKQLPIIGNRSINFHFSNFWDHSFFLNENYVMIQEEGDINVIKNTIENFTKQMKLNILSVHYARHVLSLKKLSSEEQSFLIQENLSSLLEKKSKDYELNAYDQMQNFLMKLSAEKKLSQIKANLSSLMNKRPQNFDRDIYESMNTIRALFSDHFTATRDPKFVSRLIGYFYLFIKITKQKTFNTPSERHLTIKLLKSPSFEQEKSKIALGILVSINLLQESERFEQKHFIQSIKSCVQDIKPIKNSYISDKREENILCYYIEIEKTNSSNFSLDEIARLKKLLPSEIKTRIEMVINPIFMPRNEEEMLRNIILLSKQIKYVRDIPQLIISYDKQTNNEISFIVILVRLLKNDTPPLKEYFAYSQTFLKYLPEEIKIIGSLKKKYPKEANIFRISLKKSSFYRKDYSLDLQKARQVVVNELAKVIGDFRDYNGGMIHKQTLALDRLKREFPNLGKENEFFIENFFYSIKPGIMQSILDTNILKHFFQLFLQILDHKNMEKNYVLKTMSTPKYLLTMTASHLVNFKESLESAIISLKIPSFDLTSCFLLEDGISALGYIYRTSNLAEQAFFHNEVVKVMNAWSNEIKE